MTPKKEKNNASKSKNHRNNKMLNMDKTLILKCLRGFETTEHTKYTERKKARKDAMKSSRNLDLKALRGVETTEHAEHTERKG